jgi:glutamate--cysteine ligase
VTYADAHGVCTGLAKDYVCGPESGAQMAGPVQLTREALIETFQGYGAPRDRWLVGGEFERAVVRPDGSPVGYFDPDGIGFILGELAKDERWTPEYEADHVIALQGPRGANITLEPGGQVELSGAPHATLPELAEEMLAARAQLLAIAEGRELHWIACGLTPYARMEDVGWVPKSRYEVMREYLPRFGDLAHHMMKGTCSVQANFDFSDEADCARKVKLCSRIAPLTTAMFANSPISEGKETGYQSYRGHIWTRTDPARTGFPRALREDYTHEAWVDYLFDVPMMFFHDGTRYRPAHGKTFREFAERGIDGLFPGPKDWALHQTSVFPEVRIKSTIEVRGADCVSSELALSFCALFTGLMYCNRALDEALVLEACAARPAGAPMALGRATCSISRCAAWPGVTRSACRCSSRCCSAYTTAAARRRTCSTHGVAIRPPRTCCR